MLIIDCHCHAGIGDGLTGPWNTRAGLGRYLRRARAAGIGRTVVFPVISRDYDRGNRSVADLVAAAHEHGRVLYAVPGSPRVLERTVDLLAARRAGPDPAGAGGGIDVEVLPALSFVDLTWVRLGIDPYEAGVRLVGVVGEFPRGLLAAGSVEAFCDREVGGCHPMLPWQ